MRRFRLALFVLTAALLAAALPRPSAALVCEVLCWTSGNQTCWQDKACRQHCCLTSSPLCSSPCN
jgi:hypothetical protein